MMNTMDPEAADTDPEWVCIIAPGTTPDGVAGDAALRG